MLTDTLHLPDHMDLTRANLSSLISMDQLFEVRQERGHPEAGGDHKNALKLAHWSTDSVRSTEHHPTRAEGRAILAGLNVIEEVPGQSPARFHEQVQSTLSLVRPRGHHERMALQEGPEVYGRNPQVDILSGFDLQRQGKGDTDLDRSVGVSHQGSGVTVPEGPISPQDADALDDRRREEQAGGDVEIHTWKQRIGRQMTPDRIGGKHGQGLMRPKKDFVGRSAQEGMRE